jgi:hypothetical protein
MSDPAPRATLHLDMQGDVPVARLTPAHVVFEWAVAEVAQLIGRLVADGVPHLLLDGSLVPFASPTLVERLQMVRTWAEAADGRLRIAMVAPAALIDPERFGVVAAGNFGLSAQVFVHEEDALAWLREERAAELRRQDGARA